ncbi:MAG TPA: glycosyltransferase family 4 protein [Solirubrobacteraceae bacterium]|jgi:glycosyltransferase involved in cell wall biosynthesis|nr:glycosyltransferase family 4 protein [Solirubrobacteraceae bacterium]
MRTLLVAGPRKPPEAQLRAQIASDEMPDTMWFEDAIGAMSVDEDLLATVPGLPGRLLRALPFLLAQAIETFRRRRDVDAAFCWGEIPSITTALVLTFSRRPVLAALLLWPSKPKKAIPLRILARRIDVWLVPSPLQADFVRDRLKVAPDRIARITWPVDTRYWRPKAEAQDAICAVGQEMRDYPTFIEAIRPLGIPCHVAIGASVFAETSESWYADLRGDLPPGVTVGPKSYQELRELYAQARFVVVPLRPSVNDSGITAILEAMSMGRAVIVTETPGQTGTLVDGVNCRRVPPHDPIALREAMSALWQDPELCDRLGKAGRELVENVYDTRIWTNTIVDAINERRPPAAQDRR